MKEIFKKNNFKFKIAKCFCVKGTGVDLEKIFDA